MNRNLNRRIHPIAEADGLSPKKPRKRLKVMKKPDYYRECIISARCSDWVEQEPDTKYIAILVPAKHEFITECFGVDVPEHWEVWNAIYGLNETLKSPWIVTKWEYLIEEEYDEEE